MTQDTKVAVCVVTHNCESDVASFLAAVAGLRERPWEVVVVDSGSHDGTVQLLREFSTTLALRVEALSENVGYAAAMNRALELTDCPWILALNADTSPEAGFLGALLSRAERHPELRVAAVTGRLARPGEPARLDACGMFLTPSWRHHDRGSGELDRGQWRTPQRVFGATGAAVLLRRRALDDVATGGEIFASEFHSFREDAELAFRLRERGWEVLYEPLAVAEHRRFNTPNRRRAMPAHVNYHSLKNRYLLRAYHQSLANLLLTLVPTLLRDLGALAYAIALERSSLGAYLWLWRNRRRILAKRRQLRARRSAPQRRVDRWFWTRGLPL